MLSTSIVRCVDLHRLARAPVDLARVTVTLRPREAPAALPGSAATHCSSTASDKLRLYSTIDFLFVLFYSQMESQWFTIKNDFNIFLVIYVIHL